MIEAAGNISTFDLFRLEVEKQVSVLGDGLLSLQRNEQPAQALRTLLRAARSVRDAASMVDSETALALARAMEDCFSAAQQGELQLQARHVELLLNGVEQLSAIATQRGEPLAVEQLATRIRATVHSQYGAETISDIRSVTNTDGLTTESLLRLVGEVQAECNRLPPLSNALWHIKRRQSELIGLIDRLHEHLLERGGDEYSRTLAAELHTQANRCRHLLSERLLDLNEHDRRMHTLGNRLHSEVISTCMRPFAEVATGLPHQVRELARQLGKRVELQIEGLDIQVDREILQRLEAPLRHLLSNALQHGLESLEERRQNGKPRLANIQLRALQRSGMLFVQIQDDGRGFDLEQLRARLVCEELVEVTTAAYLNDAQLLEQLFQPGQPTHGQLRRIFGGGAGLEAVIRCVQQMRGAIRASSEAGKGTCIELQLPITLSSQRALVVDIGSDVYAIPLARIERTLTLAPDQVESQHGRRYFLLDKQPVDLVFANQVFGYDGPVDPRELFSILVLGEGPQRSGLVVERFIGERTLMVQALDPRLGRLQDISAASVLENGDVCLMVDVDALLHTIHSAPPPAS